MTWVETGASSRPIGTEEQLRARIGSLQWLSLIVGIVALAVAIGLAMLSKEWLELFYRGYLFAYFFWTGLALGCGVIAMIHNLTGGRWGPALRRVVEAANGNMLMMVVLAIPLGIAIFTKHIYGWAGYGGGVTLGAHKAFWLRPSAVLIRGLIYLAVWVASSFMIRIGSRRVEATRSYAVARPFAALSGLGLILYTLTMTGAVVDWAMSITPDWYSTMYTLIFAMGQILSAFCFATLADSLLIRYKPVAGKISKDQFNDLSSLMFAFTILWAYMAFSQLIISWMGNLKSEMAWYGHRNVEGWLVVGLSLMILQFLLPFLLLMNKQFKRTPDKLLWVAAFILLMRLVDLLYLIKPQFTELQISWMDLLAPIGIGGLFMFGFFARLKAGKLEPPPLVNEYTAMEVTEGHGILGATEYGAAISHRKGPVP